MIKDEKFSTGLMALRDIIMMRDYRPDLSEEIINLFLYKDLMLIIRKIKLVKFSMR